MALVALCGCGVIDNAIANHVIERQERVRTYDGVYVERGSVPGDPSAEVRGRVRFAAPSDFVIEVLSPEAYKGDTIAYLESQLWLYSARTNSGIHVRSIPWSQDRWREWVRETVSSNRDAYDYEAQEKVTIAGRVAAPWYLKPREPGLPTSLWFMDDEFTTTLRYVTEGFSFAFEEVAFNRPMERPTFDPPADAAWFEWDMGAPSISLDEVRTYANFTFLQPDPELGLERTRIVWSLTDLAPVLAAVYERGPFYVSVAEYKDEGFHDRFARGVDVSLGDTKGRVASIGSLTLLGFSRAGTQVTIVSNLPLHELLGFARSLQAR